MWHSYFFSYLCSIVCSIICSILSIYNQQRIDVNDKKLNYILTVLLSCMVHLQVLAQHEPPVHATTDTVCTFDSDSLAQYSGPLRNRSVLRGDVNTDGKVTVADVTALVNILIGTAERPTDEELESGHVSDVNYDHALSLADVKLLVDIILGKIDQLPFDPDDGTGEALAKPGR